MIGAIDIGGTKTLLADFDIRGKLLKKLRLETPKDYREFKGILKENADFFGVGKLDVLTVGVPGLVNAAKGVALAFGNLPWENVPIKRDIEDIFKCPVLIQNDAKLAGLYEAVMLDGKYRKVLYLTVSTGIGAGLIINERITHDFENIEPGQMLFEHEGKLERWEKFASGRAIYAQFGKPAKDIKDKQSWYIIAHNIAVGMIDLIASLTPDVIIIGGGVGSHFEKFEARLKEDLKNYENNLLRVPPILKAVKAEDAVIYGCYCYGKASYERNNN